MSSVKTDKTTPSGRTYWRSLDELAETAEFQSWVGREFPDISAEVLSPVSRRRFLSLMGASFALAGATGCNLRRPEEHIMPYTKLPEDVLPGRPNHYATTAMVGGRGVGLLVESNAGRPTKIEGNPNHPQSLGGVDARTVSSILHLYDPDRSHGFVNDGEYTSAESFEAFAASHFGELRSKSGAGLAILSEPSSSPTLARLRKQLMSKMPQAKWYTWSAINDDNALAGAKAAYGQDVLPTYDFSKADVILSLDGDFLTDPHTGVVAARQFASRRRVDRTQAAMNRLYVAEARFSTTGAAADHRMRIRSSDVEALSWAVAAELEAAGVRIAGLEALKGQMGSVANLRTDWVKAVAADLASGRGKGLVVAGRGQPAAVHALVAAINEGLGAVGTSVTYVPSPLIDKSLSHASMAALIKALNGGSVDTLVILGGNPVYDAPADLDFASALGKASTAVHVSLYWDETGSACKWHVPATHFMEAWSDARSDNGTVSVAQPLIEPMFGGMSDIEVVARIAGESVTSGYDLVRATWAGEYVGPDFEKGWRRWLHDGVVADSALTSDGLALDRAGLSRTLSGRKASGSSASKDNLEVVFLADHGTYDGRYANNGWLQEVPDPITNLTWDNAALVSTETAKALGLDSGDMVKLTVDGRSLEIVAMVLPGMADFTVAVALGFGRKNAGRVGNGVGFDTYTIRTSAASWFATGASITKTGGRYELATTAEHYGMDLEEVQDQMNEVDKRELIREATLDEFKANPKFAKEAVKHPPLKSIWGETHSWEGQQWGMVIDLNACVGCNACTVACQSENNIPVVGKEEVINGREMTWIRLDRYFSGSVDDPQIVYQPIACMHCETAPCETVCPVNATAHSREGTNDMAYNRCIGTRYCANNCPFKVRRFNYLDWHGDVDELVKMVHNPDVTVRMRGVMEKCTYCIQRVHRAKREATVAGKDSKALSDGAVTTACEQACPAQAITFGNINDPTSRVAKLKKMDRNYEMLAELNIRPRTSYLARVRNPNPKLG